MSVDFTLVMSHASDCLAGASPFTPSLLFTLLTPGRLATVSPANVLEESSETVPVKVTTPSLDWILTSSPLRYVLKICDCFADDSMLSSAAEANKLPLMKSKETTVPISARLYVVFFIVFFFLFLLFV